MRVHVLLSLLTLSLIACPKPSPPVPPGPSPTDASFDVYDEACANLATLRCPEGLADNCAATLRVTAAHVNLAPECLASAATAEVARACGTVDCQVVVGAKPAATCANACAVIKRYGCPEAPDCLATCNKVVAAHLVDFKLSCLAEATSKAALVRCGSVECK